MTKSMKVFSAAGGLSLLLTSGCVTPVALTPSDDVDYEIGQSVRLMIEKQNMPVPRIENHLVYPASGFDAQKASAVLRKYRGGVAESAGSKDVIINVGKPR